MEYIVHTVQQGDSVESIAFQHGMFWETIWNDGKNSQLKGKRHDPNILYPGDIVHVPEKRERQESGASGAKHRFKRKGVPSKFQLHLLRGNKPRKNLKYRMIVDQGNIIEGSTDGDGWIRQPISPSAKKIALTLLPKDQPPETHMLDLSFLDPIDTVSGAQSRLANLGYFAGESTGTLDAASVAAIRGFQKAHDLTVNGRLDDATLSKLKDAHKS
jgi:hypothetical protein